MSLFKLFANVYRPGDNATDERGSEIARNSVIENSVSDDFWCTLVDGIYVFDCRLSGKMLKND